MKEKKTKKLIMAIIKAMPVLIIILFAIFIFSSKEHLTINSIANYTPKNPFLASAFLLCLYGLKSLSVFFPISFLEVIGGIVFSIPIAIIINIIGTAICVSIPYWIGRFSGKELADKIIKKYPKFEKVVFLQKDSKCFFSYFVRVLGVLPCDIVSLYSGCIKIPYGVYLLGSLLGFLPSLVATTILGTSITDPKSPTFIISLSFNIIFSLFSFVLYKRFLKKQKAKNR